MRRNSTVLFARLWPESELEVARIMGLGLYSSRNELVRGLIHDYYCRLVRAGDLRDEEGLCGKCKQRQ